MGFSYVHIVIVDIVDAIGTVDFMDDSLVNDTLVLPHAGRLVPIVARFGADKHIPAHFVDSSEELVKLYHTYLDLSFMALTDLSGV